MQQLKFVGKIVLFLPVFYAIVALILNEPMAGMEIPMLAELLRLAAEQVLFLLQTWAGYFPDPRQVDTIVVMGGFIWATVAFALAVYRLVTR